MSLTAAQLEQLAKILRRLDEGEIATPRVSGAVGSFLRQYAHARETAARALGIELPSRGWVTGEQLVPLELALITSLELRIDSEITGSFSSAVAMCETLGTTVSVTSEPLSPPAACFESGVRSQRPRLRSRVAFVVSASADHTR